MRRLDQHSAESQTELEVAHERGELFPGAYVQVTLEIDPANGAVTIPAGTLLFRSGKPAVGVVHQNGTVEIRKIAINRDLGSKLVVSQGLSESDQIITSAPPGLVDGSVVNVVCSNEPEPRSAGSVSRLFCVDFKLA
jgi:multidrug efflux pump subunit AcrA (membrane-fusion protein)